MSEKFRLFLDQMFKVDVAQGLRELGYDVLRASETHQNRADDQQILQKVIRSPVIAVDMKRRWS